MHGLMRGGWKRGRVLGPPSLQRTAWTAPDQSTTAPVSYSTFGLGVTVGIDGTGQGEAPGCRAGLCCEKPPHRSKGSGERGAGPGTVTSSDVAGPHKGMPLARYRPRTTGTPAAATSFDRWGKRCDG